LTALRFDGTQIQNEIYVSGESRWPIAPGEWEARAAETLEPGPFGYIAGGAGVEATLRANRDAFDRHRLVPRMLTGNSSRELSVEVLGTVSPFPFFLAPVGVLSIAHPEGELAAARAAAALRVPFVLSTAASHSIEEIAEAMGDGPRWFQLYWVNDREVVASLVDRAAAAGYSAAAADARSVAGAVAAVDGSIRIRRISGRISGTAANITARIQKSSAYASSWACATVSR